MCKYGVESNFFQILTANMFYLCFGVAAAFNLKKQEKEIPAIIKRRTKT